MKKTAYRSGAALLAAAAALCTPAVLPVSAEEQAEYLPLNRGGKVFSDRQDKAYASCNEKYYDFWSGGEGSWLAYDLSDAGAQEKIELVWYSGSWGNYDFTVLPDSPYASLAGYTIEVNAAEGGSYPEDGWEPAVTVPFCTTHSAEHVIGFAGMNWVRLTVNSLQSGTEVSLNVDIHAMQPVFDSTVTDSWMFYGDSITACGMTTFGTDGGNFADYLHALDPTVYPAQQNGGIGGIRSTEGKENIDRWLQDFAGQYVSIAYGTNDCWGNQTGAENYYENTLYMIQAVQAAGKTAVLPKIPYSTEPGVASYVGEYNAMIDRICAENDKVIPGPDFYTFFRTNPELLSGDGVHPSSEGYAAMRKLWAETMYEKIYRLRGKPHAIVLHQGDVDLDGDVDHADTVLLARWLTGEVQSLREWSTADMNGDGKLNAIDLSLLKHLFLRTDDERIEQWLQSSGGKYHLLIDYGAWTDALTDISATGDLSCKISDNSIMHTLVLEMPKPDPRDAGIHSNVTVTLTMHTPDGRWLDAELTFYQYIYGTDGKLLALYDYTNYSVDETGKLSAGVSS